MSCRDDGALRISYDNFLDTSTLTAVQGQTDKEGLKNIFRGDFYRAGIASPYEILKGNFSSKKELNMVYLAGHNFTKDAKIKIIFYSDFNQAGTIEWNSHYFDAWNFSGNKDFLTWEKGHSVRYIPAIIAAKSFSLFIKDPTNSFVQMERLWIGEYFCPHFNMSWGTELKSVDNSRETVMESGSSYSDGVAIWREMAFNLAFINYEDRATFFDLCYRIGKRRDFFISMFPEVWSEKERDYTILAKQKNFPAMINDFYQNFAARFELREI